MSRSYRNRKNNGIAHINDGMKIRNSRNKYWKKQSNKKMRKMELVNGCMYKKNGFTWYIHDYRFTLHIEKDWHKKINCKDAFYDYKYFMTK